MEAIDQWQTKGSNRVAYENKAGTHTYGELTKWSNGLAHYLADTVTNKSRQPIVVYGNLEFEMIVSFLGVSKAGVAYIPIEEQTPVERLKLILEIAKPSLIISVASWPVELACEIPVVSKEQLVELFHQPAPTYTTAQPVTGDETYYIIFTSGTTGLPKGVQVTHDNLKSFVEWELKDFQLPKHSRFLAQAPFSFDLSVMSLYPALVSGGVVVPLEKAIVEDFKTLFETLPQLYLNIWVSTPSFVEICLLDEHFNGKKLPFLTHFLFCGEELSKTTATLLLERFPHSQLYNTYGPTETTVAISRVLLTKELLKDFSRVPIGYPKSDTEVVIVNENLQEVPVGEVGEIVITGPSVTKGYLNNSQKTKEAFLTVNRQRAYRTGDGGRQLPNGLLAYEGRLDFQVKLHGFRMELEDIDHYLNASHYIKQALVVPKYRDNKVQQLVAFVVANAHQFPKEFLLTKAIKAELGQRVMPYMIPQKIVYVAHLPRTANGKLDRKQLIAEVNGQ
jgi:D-alanine--poly(phosphoribitol) ligase subunit 1